MNSSYIKLIIKGFALKYFSINVILFFYFRQIVKQFILMKKTHLFFVLIMSLIIQSCIGEDIIDDAITAEIRFLNAIESIEVDEVFELNVSFFNNIGQQEEVEINWFSENSSIASVDNNGVILGISEGETIITAEATIDGITTESSIEISVIPSPIIIVPQASEVTILNPIENISISETHIFEVVYLNDLSEEQNIEFVWFSDTPEVVIVNERGLLTAVSEGSAIITVSGIVNGETVEDSISVSITESSEDLNTKTGVIITTSSYVLEGGFSLSEIENTNDLELLIQDNYRASTRLPGLYVYLSNNPNSIGNALEIGAVETFSGEHTYLLNNIGINDYAYVLYWCKPFGVKVGEGRINN